MEYDIDIFDELISFIKNKRYTTLKIVTKAR